MKKIILAMIGIILAYSASSSTFSNGKNYISLDQPVTSAPQILEFFSFYCQHCYEFEKAWYNHKVLKKNFTLHHQIMRYHIMSIGGGMGKTLTHVWAIAVIMGLEEKVIFPIFEGLLINKTIFDKISLKKIFLQSTGITSTEYDSKWNDLRVLSLLDKQVKVAKDINLQSVPTILVHGRYIVKSNELDMSSIHSYINQYANIIRYLLSKK
ncbi:DsbA family protein [Candidatus Erwinia haradaeae]|uniref:Thiol:disulfide interchange protein n=1 Tax=Candidatus Erwinia haradaeae TaxID=1922217 RepID=A0A451D257_9GAMM|nr:DsbA family protein [Candidatus Erwinia haradaeae]VFP79692.1 Thiol:disulfide interchange protein DsbA [Candidatus Erwinia haradaeae]